ncbi:DUF3238 domain-containing protein [Paenibacillus konkukensis]|uniref:DUF3238 domain-containing protein n=1 Tax=Paenibacillus konkukensis TaxID=2020716 RepID=UPI00201E4282|nr:DUF3238 domain-containing protein [Paenibacillus konkukensis]
MLDKGDLRLARAAAQHCLFGPADRLNSGKDPWGDVYLGNGKDRQFGVNDLNVKTLQYGVMNLDNNSVVGFNYVTVTQRVDGSGKVIAEKRDSNSGMSISMNGGMLNAFTSASNELSRWAPSLDSWVRVDITNQSDVLVFYQTDFFPSYEGYISINGGSFNTMYREAATPAPVNPFINLAFTRGMNVNHFTYNPK